MNSKEMVSVPRELVSDLADCGDKLKAPEGWMVERLREAFDKPAKQHQGEPVERDERLDSDLIAIIAALQADLTARDERIDELESQLMPDLHSRPEERGTPEAEPCSGCGTPGWTGACNKCIPY